MKLHQHQNPETIFFIHPPTDAMEAAVHVAFDDVEAAKSYIKRFKTFSDAEIVECRLNPVFYTDISNDCYFVQLNKYDDGYAIDLVADLQRSELARDGYYFFEEDQICIYLMAGSENGAFHAARKIRDQLKPYSSSSIQVIELI